LGHHLRYLVFDFCTGKESEPSWYTKYTNLGREKLDDAGQFPFASIIAINNQNTGNSWFCSGGLIDEDYVLFGANCLYKDGWDISKLKIKAGFGMTSFNNDQGEWINVRSYKGFSIDT